jgi:hypothetical protein
MLALNKIDTRKYKKNQGKRTKKTQKLYYK